MQYIRNQAVEIDAYHTEDDTHLKDRQAKQRRRRPLSATGLCKNSCFLSILKQYMGQETIGICLGGFSVKPAILFCEGWTYHLRGEKNRCEKHTPFPYPFLLISAFFKKKKILYSDNKVFPQPLFPKATLHFLQQNCPKLLESESGIMLNSEKYKVNYGIHFHFSLPQVTILENTFEEYLS